MKSLLTTCVCAALALPLAAQTGQKPKAETMPAAEKPAYVGLDKALGSKVYATGAGGATPTEEASKLELKDLVVDPCSGEVFWAVLENDGHSVAVPPSLIECTHKTGESDPKLELHVDAGKLKALPLFDLEKAREASFDPAVIALDTSWSSVGIPAPASAPRAKDVSAPTPAVVVTGTEFMALPVRFALASKLDGIDVYARGEDFGDVSDLVLDTKDHHIAYAIVSHGGVLGVGDEKYLVPFKALCVAHPKDDNDKLVLVLDMPADALAVEAGRYKEPEKGILSKERAEQADKQFEAAIRSKKTGGTDEKSSGRQGSAVRQGG